MKFADMDIAALEQLRDKSQQALADYKATGMALDMSRGKPCHDQLELSNDLHQALTDFKASDGVDVRNYGVLLGIPEARQLFGDILGVPAAQVIIGGSSSLNLMYDMLSRAYIRGVEAGATPWHKQEKIKFLCPSPGYDRHFAVSDSFGVENIPVPMCADGPDMDIVEQMVNNDASIKGMWCVPMYSNPDGITYSDDVVRRIAALKPAASDFRLFWDNAYCVHHLYEDDQDCLLNIYDECVKNGSEDMVYMFASTSKITMASAGLAAVAMSPKNFEWIKQQLSIQTIGYNRVNQLRHMRFLPDLNAVNALMMRHAQILRPKFEMVLNLLEKEIAPLEIASWHKPKGGYFISFFAPEGTAKRIVALCKDAGVTMTGAGASYPYGNDPADSNIRIAPTFPSLDELQKAMEVFCWAVKLAAAEQKLS